eukprot:TRINITY_DN3502_c0_g1_i2.p1 TRINITY_DN3502_c0_g1~~TRINITY_DN3502_c0_g1_i2.p1  ORF type:complete len:512 (+),score=50.98 TRINITY_DN3502_c0_g1_i2:35-1570(+)
MSYFDGLKARKPPPITNLVSDSRFAPHFVSIDNWAKKIREVEHGRRDMDDFFPGLDVEIQDLNAFVEGEYQTLKHSLNFIAQRVLAVFHQSESKQKSSIALLQKQLDVIAEDLCNLETFVGLNVMFLMKIVLRHDQATGAQATNWFAARIDQEFLCKVNFDGLLMSISDLYFTLAHGITGSSSWNPPDSFDRQTTKFWVKPEHLLRVKLMIAKHLPVLVWGQDQGISVKKIMNGQLNFNTSDASLITSVYFDNDNCQQYHNRLTREEGATLIRVRWYGNYGRNVFIEQKTHHEAWVDQVSVKERFQMESEHVKGYLLGTKTYKDWIPKLRAKGVSNETLASNWALANEIAKNIQTHDLHPVIRTVYLRTAFQLTSSNNVRISLDTKIQFIKEIVKSNSDPEWVHLGKVPSSSELTFPLGVLEIKLHDAPPAWVTDLITSGYLIRADHFSKFQHAMAIFYPRNISLRPHWFDNPIVNINASGSHAWYTVGALTHAQTHKPIHLYVYNEVKLG